MQRGMQRMNQNQKPGGRRSRTGVLAANLLWAVAAGLAAAVGAMGAMAVLLTRVSLPAAAAVPLATLAVCRGAGCWCAAKGKTGWRWGRWWAFCSSECLPRPPRSTAAGM